MHYPELGGISYDGKKGSFKMRFICLNKEFDREDKITPTLQTWLEMRHIKPQSLDVSLQSGHDYCLLYVERDAATFSVKEVQFLVDLLHQIYPAQLLGAQMNYDDGFYPPDFLDYAWSGKNNGRGQDHIVAYREKGQVLVFNC